MSSEWRQIRLHGNQLAITVGTGATVGREGTNIIACRDGFRFSVLAGPGAYCLPRPALLAGTDYPPSFGQVGADYPGPYTHVEVGFFDGKLPKPRKLWRPYGQARPRGFIVGMVTVFAFVPTGLVYDLIRRHGGEGPVVGPPVHGRPRAVRNRLREMDHMANLADTLTCPSVEVWTTRRDAMRWKPEASDVD